MKITGNETREKKRKEKKKKKINNNYGPRFNVKKLYVFVSHPIISGYFADVKRFITGRRGIVSDAIKSQHAHAHTRTADLNGLRRIVYIE